MFSSELAEQIHAFLLAMPPGGPLHDALERFTAVYREALPKGGAPLERNPPDLAAFGPWHAAIASVLEIFKTKTLRPSAVFVALGMVERAARAFLSEDGSLPALATLVEDVEEFRSRYDESLGERGLGNVLPLLAAADRLSRSIAATRDCLEAVEEALTPVAVDPPQGLERLTLVLYSEMSLSELAAKLAAMDELYRTVGALVDPSGPAHSPQVVKVESGSLWLLLLGLPRVVRLIDDLIRGAVQWMYRNYTREGEYVGLSLQAVAFDDVLGLRAKLRRAGIDHEAMDQQLSTAAATIASKLNTLLDREPRVKINGETLSVGPAVEERMLRESRMRSIGTGTPDADSDAPTEGQGP